MKTTNQVGYADYIFLIPGNNFSLEFMISWTKTLTYLVDKKISFAYKFSYSPIIQQVRNNLVGNWDNKELEDLGICSEEPFDGKMKCKKVIFIDSDIIWEPQDLQLLLDSDKDIISGAYLLSDGKTASFFYLENTLRLNYDKIYELNDDFEIHSNGFGFVAVKLEVLEKMGFPWFAVEYNKNEDGEWTSMGEDLYFSVKARKYGYKTYLHPKVAVGHYKSRTTRLI